MSNGTGGNQCPECAKVILNGGIAARNLDEICNTIYEHLEKGHKFENIKELVIQANKIEDEVDRFRRMVLEGIEFDGPWPESLKWVKK